MLQSFIIPKRGKKIVGTYIGEVVQARDDFGANRVKVKLLGLTDKLGIEVLPYYSIRTEVSDSPNANVSIPPVGAKVYVELKGDIYNGEVVSNMNELSPH